MHPYVNPANAVTASRYLTVPPIIYFIDRGMYQAATLTALACGLLDKLDGIVAKKFDCKTDFGSIFDAITDAVCYGTIIAVLAAYGWVPWQAVVILLGLGGLNTAFRAVYARRARGLVNYRSFAMERVVAYYAYLCGFGTTGFEVDYFYWGAVVVTTIVVAHDSKRMLIDPVPA